MLVPGLARVWSRAIARVAASDFESCDMTSYDVDTSDGDLDCPSPHPDTRLRGFRRAFGGQEALVEDEEYGVDEEEDNTVRLATVRSVLL